MAKIIFFTVLCVAALSWGQVWLPVALVPAYNYSIPTYNYSIPVAPNNLLWNCRQHNFNATGTHSLFLGCVGYNDKLLYNETHVKSGKWFGTREVTIQYPASGYIRGDTIKGIWIFDRYTNNLGGYARILAGGIGSRNVTLQLYSNAWLRGFNFLVQIYGQ